MKAEWVNKNTNFMSKIIIFCFFICNLHCVGQNDPLSYEKLFGLPSEGQVKEFKRLGYELQSLDSLERIFFFKNKKDQVDVYVYFDSLWKNAVLISYLTENNEFYYNLLNEVSECKKYELIPNPDVSSMSHSYKFNGKKLYGYVVFKSIIKSEKLFRTIMLIDPRLSE